MLPSKIPNARQVLIAALLATGIVGSSAAPGAAPTGPGVTASQATTASNAQSSSSARPASNRRLGMPSSAARIYALTWGVDHLSAKLAESGQLVRFSYRVVDVDKAKVLHDKASNPQLLDEEAHAVLQVPVMEKVGPLRQTTPPDGGKSYWMVFSNKGNLVKAGHRVSIVIGPFRVEGLVVQP